MEKENFERAEEIQKEITELKYYIIPIVCEKDPKQLNWGVIDYNYYSIEDGYRNDMTYNFRKNNCPDILKDQLKDDIQFILDRVVNTVQKHIKKLEKEFNEL